MKIFARRIAIVLSATAVTVGLMGTAAPAEAKSTKHTVSLRDSGWPGS